MNILIVPPVNPHNTELVISLVEQILSKYEDSSISIVVNLETYNSYYNCSSIHGLLVEPDSIIDKLRLIPQKHYDAVFIARNSMIWNVIAKITKTKLVRNISKQVSERNFDAVVNMLSACS